MRLSIYQQSSPLHALAAAETYGLAKRYSRIFIAM